MADDRPATSPVAKRRRLAVIGAALLAVLAFAVGWAIWAAGRETTDDAQVEADVVPIAARVAGNVKSIPVVENQAVKKGQLLLQLDDAEYDAKAKRAEAELEVARAQAQVAGSQIASARAALVRAQAEGRKADLDLTRDRQLRRSGSTAQVRLDEAEAADEVARAALEQARANLSAADASERLAQGRVKSAQAALDLARLDLSYTRVVASEDGVVSRLTAREGQQVSLGQTLGALVPDAVYGAHRLRAQARSAAARRPELRRHRARALRRPHRAAQQLACELAPAFRGRVTAPARGP